jgi:hypothetical protein
VVVEFLGAAETEGAWRSSQRQRHCSFCSARAAVRFYRLEVEGGKAGPAGPNGQWGKKLAAKIMKKIGGLPLQFGLKQRSE